MGCYIRHYDYENQPDAMPFDTMVVNTETVFTTDHDFVSIGRQIKPGFVDLFEKAVDFYIEGDWLNAQQNLTMAA